MSSPNLFSFNSSNEDIDDNEVEEGDCLGVSFGEPLAVDGEDSFVVEVTVLLRRSRLGSAVVDMSRAGYYDVWVAIGGLWATIGVNQIDV